MAVTKNPGKLPDKLAAFAQECESFYDIRVVCQNQVKIHHVKKLHNKIQSGRIGQYLFLLKKESDS